MACLLVKFGHKLDVFHLVFIYCVDLEQGNHGLVIAHCDFINRGVLEKTELVHVFLKQDAVCVTGHSQLGVQVRGANLVLVRGRKHYLTLLQ